MGLFLHIYNVEIFIEIISISIIMCKCSFTEKNLIDLQMDLSTFIMKQQCECLNESDHHTFSNCLKSDNGYLESDEDEQLIMSITFSQPVKVHSLKIKAPAQHGPKNIKLFINQPRTIDFEMASSNRSIQDLT